MVSAAARLKGALVGDPAARFVYLGNFEVERQWAQGELGLPGIAAPSALVARMDELALSLAEADDLVLLKSRPDEAFLQYLRSIGLPTPTIVTPERGGERDSVTMDALADDAFGARVARVAGVYAYLIPHGLSAEEEELADRCGLRVAVAPARVCKVVNSKVYSRRLAEELGLRQPQGWVCESLTELATVLRQARDLLARGRRVVVKDAYGVSGKGMVVVEQPRRLDQLHRMVASAAATRGTDRVNLVVEEWVDLQGELAYQFTLSRDGTVHFDHIGEAIISGGAHQGNRMPARLAPGHEKQLRAVAEVVGRQLSRAGYHGVVGIDAAVGADGELYPLGEINARNTMMTYRAPVRDRLAGSDMIVLGRHYPVRVGRPVSFSELHDLLHAVLLRRPGGEGVIINSFATVNAGMVGRLYAMVVAPTEKRLSELDAAVGARLAELEALTGPVTESCHPVPVGVTDGA